LAPSHTSNQYIPDVNEDPLIIRDVPDFFVTGHIHRLSVGQYKNITLLNCSCWSDVTEDQEKRGLEPQPGKLPLVNLKTREVKIINFMKEKEPKLEKALIPDGKKEVAQQ
jgi:DNA polymerase II small subunit